MSTQRVSRVLLAILCLGLAMPSSAQTAPSPTSSYPELVKVFEGWRAFELPAMHGDVPDYTPAAMAAKAAALPAWQKKLEAFPTDRWPIAQVNDLKLVQAEMNGFDFNLRVLRPWARDPAFYVSVWPERSDCPLREGPLAYPAIELYNYTFPLSAADQQQLTRSLSAVPELLTEARANLKDSTARDLWVWGASEFRGQSQTLQSLAAGTLTVATLGRNQHADLTGTTPQLREAVTKAQKATDDFVAWLEQLAPGKTGPSGVGKENYNWYEKNVHQVPYTWDEQVVLLKRELDRAQTSLRLEEHRNRNLPPLEAVNDPAAFDTLARTHMDAFLNFLITQEIIPDKPYIQGAMEARIEHFVPEEKRVFFSRVIHREPMLLYSHDYHWIDLARMRDEPNPSPIRRQAALSNIWDTRAEGFATAFEEIVMHAGLYDNNPRAKELVWIMLANRAARGLASLYVQANEWDLEKAGQFHGAWTPRGWAVAKDKLTGFEQLLYLRQPGYGASYVVGKLLVDRLISEYARHQDLAGKPFVLRDFMDRFGKQGMIPVPLMEAEIISTEAREP